MDEHRFIDTVILDADEVERLKDVIAELLLLDDWRRKGPAEVLELSLQQRNDGRYIVRYY
jgi:hypothetical protein